MNILELILDMRLGILLSICIIILGVWFYLKLRNDKNSEKKQILLLKNRIDILDYNNIHEDHHTVSLKFEDDKIYPQLYHIWREFEESLVIRDNIIENTLDAQHFFNEDNLCPKTFTNEVYRLVPSLLVGIGVLLTFIGLVWGISNLNINSDDTETLKKGIESIVNGASLAFFTSIAGILSSLFYSYKYQSYKTELRDIIREIQNGIDYKYPRTNPEKSLAYMREYSKATEEHLGALSEKLGDKLQEVVRSLGTEIREGVADSLSSTIGPYMEQITSRAMNSSESAFERIVEEFLDKVGKAGEEQQKLILKTNETIQKSLIDFRNDFTGQVSGLKDAIERLNTSYHFLETELVQKFDNVVQSLSVAVTALSESQQSLSEQIETQNQISTNLVEASARFETLVANLRDLIDAFELQFQNSIHAYNVATENLQTVYDANTELTQQLYNASDALKEPISLLKEEYEAMRDQVAIAMKSMSDKMSDALNAYFTQVQDQTTQRMREWNNQTTDFSSKMLDVTSELHTLIEKIRKNVERV